MIDDNGMKGRAGLLSLMMLMIMFLMMVMLMVIMIDNRRVGDCGPIFGPIQSHIASYGRYVGNQCKVTQK